MLLRETLLLIGMSAALVFSSAGRARTQSQPVAGNGAGSDTRIASRRAPTLGTDMSFASIPSPLIDGWLDKTAGDEMAAAFSLRFSFHGLYSPNGPEATARIKTENKATNEYQWFPLDAYADFLRSHDFTTVVGINVEEGPDVARDAIQRFIDRGLKSRIVAIELSNEPWLNYRPWLPEDYAARAADVVERWACDSPCRSQSAATTKPRRSSRTTNG